MKEEERNIKIEEQDNKGFSNKTVISLIVIIVLVMCLLSVISYKLILNGSVKSNSKYGSSENILALNLFNDRRTKCDILKDKYNNIECDTNGNITYTYVSNPYDGEFVGTSTFVLGNEMLVYTYGGGSEADITVSVGDEIDLEDDEKEIDEYDEEDEEDDETEDCLEDEESTDCIEIDDDYEHENAYIVYRLLDEYGQIKWEDTYTVEDEKAFYISIGDVVKTNDYYYIFLSVKYGDDGQDYLKLLTYDKNGKKVNEEKVESPYEPAISAIRLGKVGDDYYYLSDYSASYFLGYVFKFNNGKIEFLDSDLISEDNDYPYMYSYTLVDNYLYNIGEDSSSDDAYIAKYKLNGEMIEKKRLKGDIDYLSCDIFSGLDGNLYCLTTDDEADYYQMYKIDAKDYSVEAVKDFKYSIFEWYDLSDNALMISRTDEESGETILDIYDRYMNKVQEVLLEKEDFKYYGAEYYFFGTIDNNLFSVSENYDGLVVTFYNEKDK